MWFGFCCVIIHCFLKCDFRRYRAAYKIYYRVKNSPPLDPILRQLKQAQILTSISLRFIIMSFFHVSVGWLVCYEVYEDT
jgi:hypothetical protein